MRSIPTSDPSSSSGSSPIPDKAPARPPRKPELKKTEASMYQKAIEGLGLQRQGSRLIPKQVPTEPLKGKVHAKNKKAGPGAVPLPIRPNRQHRTKAPAPNIPISSSSVSERENIPPRPPRRIPSPEESKVVTPPPPLPRDSAQTSRTTGTAPLRPEIEVVKGESEDESFGELLGEESGPIVGSSSETHVADKPHRPPTTSEDLAFQKFSDLPSLTKALKTPKGRELLGGAANRLLRSSLVGPKEAAGALDLVIAAQMKAVKPKATQRVTRPKIKLQKEGETRATPITMRRSRKVSHKQIAEAEKLAVNIERYNALGKRDAIRFIRQPHFQNNNLQLHQLASAIGPYNELREIKNQNIVRCTPVLIHIVNLVGENAIGWFVANAPERGADNTAVNRFMDALSGKGTINPADAQPLLETMVAKGIISEEEKIDLNETIQHLSNTVHVFTNEEKTLVDSMNALMNQINEFITTERSYIEPLKLFLEEKYEGKTFFGALLERGIITAAQATFFEKNLRTMIDNAESMFGQLELIQRADPNDPHSVDGANLPEVLERLMLTPAPSSVYQMTMSMSGLIEKNAEWRDMISKLQELKPIDPILRRFRRLEARLSGTKTGRGAEQFYITPVQRAPRYVMLFTEVEKTLRKLHLPAAADAVGERVKCFEACTAWINFKMG